MSRYAFDGEMYAGWSTGRWFGLAGVGGLCVAWLCWQMLHGWLASSMSASSLMLAFFVMWVGAIFAGVMVIAVVGSLMISSQERGDVEVMEDGVRRIFAPGRERFVPREKIAGFVVRIGGGVSLVDESSKVLAVVPRSIVGYRECIAELKEMGIQNLPGRMEKVSSWKRFSWVEWVQITGAWTAGGICLDPGSKMQHMVSGAICVAFFVWMGLDLRDNPDRQSVWVFPVCYLAMRAIYHVVVHSW